MSRSRPPNRRQLRRQRPRRRGQPSQPPGRLARPRRPPPAPVATPTQTTVPTPTHTPTAAPTATPEPADARAGLIWPARGPITTYFGEVGPTSPRGHAGIDIAARYGSPIVAAAAGQVVL